EKLTDTLTTKTFGHDEVFQVQTSTFPGRIADIIQRNANDLPLMFGDESAPCGLRSEASVDKFVHADRHLLWSALVQGKLTDQFHHRRTILGYSGANVYFHFIWL